MREILVSIPAVEALPFAFYPAGDAFDVETSIVSMLDWAAKVAGGIVYIGTDGIVDATFAATSSAADSLLDAGTASIEDYAGNLIGTITVGAR